jgi:MtN3 and saliva related transmembrane protein
MNPEVIGYFAAFFTTAAYVPQVIKVVKHKHTQSISLGMYAILTIGIGSWVVYGLMINSPSIVVANAITFVLALLILAMKLKHG